MRWKKFLLFFLTKGLLIALLFAFLVFIFANITWEEMKVPLIYIVVMLGLTGYTILIQWLDKEVNK